MNNMEETKLDINLLKALSGKDGVYPPKALASLHTIYISGEIESSEEYTDVFETIRHAGPNDIIRFHINSQGGDMFTAIQFMRVMKETEAQIICSVEGMCMSAATLLFLGADQWEISDHSVFMFHNYSTLMMGKGGELYDGITHDRKWSANLLQQEYEGLLSPEEINGLLNNKDLWLNADEVLVRLEGFIKAKKKRLIEEEKKLKKMEKVQKSLDTE